MIPVAILVGLPGAGKSTTGRRLAHVLRVPFVDSDDLVQSAEHRTVREIFEADGETAFRRAEHAAVRDALTGFDGVLALGGGALTHRDTYDCVAASPVPVVLLRATLGTLGLRVGDARHRPLLREDPSGRLAALAVERGDTYERIATLAVDTDDRTPGQVAATVAARLHSLRVRS